LINLRKKLYVAVRTWRLKDKTITLFGEEKSEIWKKRNEDNTSYVLC
jgi:hypothetical protein